MTRLSVRNGSTWSAAARFTTTAVVAFGFYLALGDPTDSFDVVTGAVSALVVGGILSRVTFERTPSLVTVATFARALVFLPVLLTAVVRANLSLVRVVLDPDLPIDPAVVRVPAPESAFGRALLANSITLTPGTVTIDVVDDELVVHALTAASRADLLEGSIARWAARVTGDPVPAALVGAAGDERARDRPEGSA